jgi:hypothetical protein
MKFGKSQYSNQNKILYAYLFKYSIYLFTVYYIGVQKYENALDTYYYCFKKTALRSIPFR